MICEVSDNTAQAPRKEHKLSTPFYAIEVIVNIGHAIRQVTVFQNDTSQSIKT